MHIRITCSTTSDLGTDEIYRVQVRKCFLWFTLETFINNKAQCNKRYREFAKAYRTLKE